MASHRSNKPKPADDKKLFQNKKNKDEKRGSEKDDNDWKRPDKRNPPRER